MTTGAEDRLLALMVTPEPWWYWPAVRVLAALRADWLSEQLSRWRTAQAVAMYQRSRRVTATARAYQRACAVVARIHADEFVDFYTGPGGVAEAERAIARAHPEDFARAFAAERAAEGLL